MIEYKDKEYWQGLLDTDSAPMTEDETGMFLQCIMMEQSGFKRGQDEEIEKGLESSLGYKIFDKRIQAAGLDVTLPLVMFLVSLCENPAHVVMWAYTLNVIKATKGIEGRPVATEDFANAFPMGIPTEDGYKTSWNEQKQTGEPVGNSVDNFENWPGVVR